MRNHLTDSYQTAYVSFHSRLHHQQLHYLILYLKLYFKHLHFTSLHQLDIKVSSININRELKSKYVHTPQPPPLFGWGTILDAARSADTLQIVAPLWKGN